MSDVVIRISDVSVRYRLPLEPVRTLKERAIRSLRGKSTQYRELWALRHVSFEVHRGELIGLIGRNGAGKSTLLRVISRVIKPTTGAVRIEGHLAAITELGAGFHPELTGRENVFLNGTMLGYSNTQMKRKLESIVAFAELEAFIDAPLRTYSTGMVARLGFSIAVDVEPDILVIDEVLAVGDEAFQQKCLARLQQYRAKGVTILLVTHQVDTLRGLCTRAALVEQGQIKCAGSAEDVIAAYRV